MFRYFRTFTVLAPCFWSAFLYGGHTIPPSPKVSATAACMQIFAKDVEMNPDVPFRLSQEWEQDLKDEAEANALAQELIESAKKRAAGDFPSYEMAPYSDSNRPNYLLDLLNGYHEAVRRRDEAKIAFTSQQVAEFLIHMERTFYRLDPDLYKTDFDFGNRVMIRHVLRAAVYYAAANYQKAIEHDKKALNALEAEHRTDDLYKTQRNYILLNLVSSTRKQAYYVSDAKKKADLWSRAKAYLQAAPLGHARAYIEIGLLLDDAGSQDGANAAFKAASDLANFNDRHDLLAAAFRWEGDLMWRTHLSAVRDINKKILESQQRPKG